MSERSVIIIGAGLAGLAAGVYARRNGYRARIFEHHGQPGGVAAWWRRGAYQIDGGIHFLMEHRPGGMLHRLYQELGTVPADSVADMAEYGAFVDEQTGRRLLIGSRLDDLAADLVNLSPQDTDAIFRFVAAARALREAGGAGIGMGNPPELAGPLEPLRQLWDMRKALRYFGGAHNRSAAEFAATLHDPTLRFVIENLFLPEVPLWFLYMVLGLLAGRQMGLLTHGCEGFVLPIEQRYRDLGGEITYHATVEKILVENDRAVGVRLASGEEHRADAVISAADGHSTLFDLLEGRYVDEKSQARYRDWRLIKPAVMLSFGVARTFPADPHFILIRLQEPLRIGPQQVDGLGLRIFNYSPHFAPAGKTVIQASFDAEWAYWDNLQRADRTAYEAEKERLVADVLRRLEAHFPGIGAQVEMTDVATPYTTWRYTRNWRGAYMGWLPTGPQMMAVLPRTLPGLGGFYMAGQWVMPGGGVPTCLLSGRDAVRIMCRRDGRKFTAA